VSTSGDAVAGRAARSAVKARRPRRVLAFVVLVAVCATAALAARPPAGPLAAPGGGGEGAIRKPGQPISFGTIFLPHYEAGRGVVLESLTPIDPPVGLHILGAFVVDASVRGGVGAIDGSPPPGFHALPIAGYVLRGDASRQEIVVGMEATRPGAYRIDRFVLRYRVGLREYEASYNASVTLCTDANLATFC
jgi:hypothetical protein